jgi:hypothetical protein
MARCDAPELLDAAEEAFDQVAVLVLVLIKRALDTYTLKRVAT